MKTKTLENEWFVAEAKHQDFANFVEFVLSNAKDKERVSAGYIKWDECSNWHIDGVIHFCGMSEIEGFNDIMKKCYAAADEMMGFR